MTSAIADMLAVARAALERFHDVTVDDDGSLTFDLSLERRSQRELHVGRRECQLACLGVEKDASKDLNG